MNYIREKVAGKKKRLIQEGYNLDLTYVTKRIIAMSYPGEGFEGFYRNPIEQVASYLNTQHKDDFKVFNLCGRKYDTSKFKGESYCCELWKDHHSPPLDLLFDICDCIHDYLQKNIERVAAIHCLAGKGRTGTIICCYLLYTGKFKSVKDVLYYYGKKRFEEEGLGVNQPCQVKYIDYFYKLLTIGHFIYPKVVTIKRVGFQGKAPNFNLNGSCKPFMKIFQVKTEVELYPNEKVAKTYKENTHDLKLQGMLTIYGDILIKVYNEGILKNDKMFRVAFNTAFLRDPLPNEERKSTLEFSLNDLDPSQLAKDDRFDKNFKMIIVFEHCDKCNGKEICDTCEPHLKNEDKEWMKINDMIKKYKVPDGETAVKLLFKTKEEDDVDKIMSLRTAADKDIQYVTEKLRTNTIKFTKDKQQLQFELQQE